MPNTTINYRFPLNVWGRSLLLGSIAAGIMFVVDMNSEENGPSIIFAAIFIFLLFAGMLSWPTFLVCYFSIRQLDRKDMPVQKKRLILYAIMMGGLLGTLFFFFETEVFSNIDFAIGAVSYTAAFTLSFFTIKFIADPADDGEVYDDEIDEEYDGTV